MSQASLISKATGGSQLWGEKQRSLRNGRADSQTAVSPLQLDLDGGFPDGSHVGATSSELNCGVEAMKAKMRHGLWQSGRVSF